MTLDLLDGRGGGGCSERCRIETAVNRACVKNGVERHETNLGCQRERVVFPKRNMSLLCTRSLARLTQNHTAATTHTYPFAPAAVGLVTVDFGSVIEPVRK